MITDLVDTFNTLAQQLQQLRQHLLETRPACYFPLNDAESGSSTDELEAACDLICDLWYHSNQDGRETRSRHGLILADHTTMTLIATINRQKQSFRQAVNQEKQQLDQQQWRERHRQLGRLDVDLRQQLQYAGLQRVHLKQCYRQLPLLVQRPLRVGFSWYNNGRSIRKISHQQAQQLLLELGEEKPHIQAQLATLAQLKANTQLAQMQTLAPIMRANLVFQGEQDEATTRKAMNVSLPLFIPQPETDEEDMQQLPVFNQVGLTPPNGRTRQSREDNRLSAEAILPSIRAYGYQN